MVRTRTGQALHTRGRAHDVSSGAGGRSSERKGGVLTFAFHVSHATNDANDTSIAQHMKLYTAESTLNAWTARTMTWPSLSTGEMPINSDGSGWSPAR